MPEPVVMVECRNCKFFSSPGNKVGRCRINPPAVDVEEEERWPQVWADEGCGQGRERVNA